VNAQQIGKIIQAAHGPLIDEAKFRAEHVGASEVAALFDCSPYLTCFELWHRKAGNISTPAFDVIGADGTPEDERIYWGVRLEAAVIEAAKERFGYIDRDPVDRLSNGNGLGGHPDRRVICPERGQGLDKVLWGDVLVLVGGNKLERFSYDFRPKIYAEIEKRVEAFWRSIRANEPPPADYTRDGSTIADLYRDGDDSVADLTGDNLAAVAAANYLHAAERRKVAQGEEDAAKAELLDKMGAASTAMINGFMARATTVAATPPTEITDEMVGATIGGRKSYRRFSVKEVA
jgi:hypothetical protein